MVPPKQTAKSTAPAKAKANAPAQESVFAAMKKNATLAKHMAKSKKVVAVGEFGGPDGDYPAILSRVSHYTKDNALGIIFEFRTVLPGDDLDNQKLLIYFSFKTTERESITEVQDRFFETLQLMGIETDIDDAALEVALNNVVANKTVITLRVKTGKKGGKFTSVVGLAEAAKHVADTEYVEESTADIPDDQAIAEEEEEWTDEETGGTVEEEPVEEEGDPALPSTWVGYILIYKGNEVEVVEADDNAMKCVVKDKAGKKVKVAFANLSPPAE